MVRLTERAGALLARIPAERTLRLTLDTDSPIIGAPAPAPGDTVLFHAGAAVLRVSAAAAAALTSSTIAVRGPEAPDDLVILGPNDPTDECSQ